MCGLLRGARYGTRDADWETVCRDGDVGSFRQGASSACAFYREKKLAVAIHGDGFASSGTALSAPASPASGGGTSGGAPTAPTQPAICPSPGGTAGDSDLRSTVAAVDVSGGIASCGATPVPSGRSC